MLRPYQAKALDLNLEKYFGTKGYIALQTFYKHIDTYIASGHVDPTSTIRYLPVPPGAVPPTPIGVLAGQCEHARRPYVWRRTRRNTAVRRLLACPGRLRHHRGYWVHEDSQSPHFNGNVSTIPGYSKFVANLTAFYEKNGFSIRGSMRYRSGFLGDFVLFSGGLDRQYVLGETVFDAQIGYDFQPNSALSGLSIYLHRRRT